MLSKIASLFFCFLIFAAVSFKALGQEPDAQSRPSPQTELSKLQDDLKMEKLRTEIAEERRKRLTAMMPDSNDPANKTLMGKIEVKDTPNTFETESVALSYEAVSVLSKQITNSLKSSAGDFNQVVIYNDDDFKKLVQYRIFESQAVPALNAYDFLLSIERPRGGNPRGLTRGMGTEVLELPSIGTSFVKSAIDFISLFRTDTEISNKDVTIEDTALGALVANEMKASRPGFKVYFPKAYIPDYDWEPADEKSVLTQLTKLYGYQEVAKGIIADYEATAAGEKEKHLYYRQIPALKALNEQVNKLLANYENRQGENSINDLRGLLRAEQLLRMLDSDSRTGILQLKVLKAGGSQRISRNLIFGSKIRHSGGAIVQYMLFDKTGTLRSSEVFYYHTGFQKMNSTRGLRN